MRALLFLAMHAEMKLVRSSALWVAASAASHKKGHRNRALAPEAPAKVATAYLSGKFKATRRRIKDEAPCGIHFRIENESKSFALRSLKTA
jgi:hypothetical protein